MFNADQIKCLEDSPVVAVLVINEPAQVEPLFDALMGAGVKNFELTMRTPKALECLSLASKRFADANIGAGIVILPEQVDQVLDAGAKFAVAPGCFEPVLERARELKAWLLVLGWRLRVI